MSIKNYECDGQMNLFEMVDKPQKFHEAEWLRGHGFKNIYDDPPPKAGFYEFTDIEYPTKIKQLEVTENGGIMFGGLDFTARWWRPIKKAEEPRQDTTDEYIQENPTCFYVTGHYLDREEGWHKMPEELPNFVTWQLIDVVLFGKKTGTVWMEHEKWEAKDWAFRSVDNRGNAESTEILAWKLSDDKPQA